MKRADLRNLCKGLMEKHGLFDHGFKIEINTRATGYYASCYAENDGRIIQLNLKVLENKDREFCRFVVLHEIAHALDYIKNGYKWRYRKTKTGRKYGLIHDGRWKKICREIGAPDKTCL